MADTVRRLDTLMSLGVLRGELGVSRRTAERIMEALPKVMIPGVAKSFVKRADVEAYLVAHTIPADPRERAA